MKNAGAGPRKPTASIARDEGAGERQLVAYRAARSSATRRTTRKTAC